LADNLDFGTLSAWRLAKSNYIACAAYNNAGTGTTDLGGMFYGNSYLGMSDCLDGTSMTIMCSERDYVHHAACWAGVGANNSANNENQPRCTFRGSFTINFDYTGAGQSVNQGKGWASLHPGGLNVLLCDASVNFLSETANTTVISNLCLRADRNAVDLPW
jgi:hypothetical protein